MGHLGNVPTKNTILYIQCNGNKSKTEANDGSKYVTDNFPTVEPSIVVEANGVQSTPETVCKVEPKSNKPYKIESYHPPVLKLTDYQV